MLHLVDPHWYQFPPLNPCGMLWGACFSSSAAASPSPEFHCHVHLQHTKSLRTPANYYVVNLAFSDFMLLFCMCPRSSSIVITIRGSSDRGVLDLRCHWVPHRLLLHLYNDRHHLDRYNVIVN
ncbi:opsin-1-like, partial [Penaeus monodon]|uniref:opsin-1-like n=1 Tax=Penaeus monodon TaxID=6687 RepID=UPI0018A73120